MPRMFNPDPGEMVDRQVILELKIYNSDTEPIGTDKKQVKKGQIERTLVEKSSLNSKQHIYLDEIEMIRAKLISNWIPDIADKPDKVEAYDKLYEELSEVNAQLWELEDQVRVYLDAPIGLEDTADRRALEVYKTITRLNDKRANLVKAVNALWNLNTSEKLYNT